MINYTWSTTHSVLNIILVAESSKIHVHVVKLGFYVLKLETYFTLMTPTLMQFLASLQEKHDTENKIMRHGCQDDIS